MAHLHDFRFQIFHSCVCTAVLTPGAGVRRSVHVGQQRYFLNPQTVNDDMHMDIAAVIVSVRVGADNGLVSGEVGGTKSLAQLLRPVNGQAVVCPVPWVKADNVVVAFHILPLLVFAIAEIGAHTGNGKIFLAAVQRSYAVILAGDKPPVFIKSGAHGKLVMLKGQILLGCAVVGVFRADMFECRQRLHLPFARLQTSRRQGRLWLRVPRRKVCCRVCRTR